MNHASAALVRVSVFNLEVFETVESVYYFMLFITRCVIYLFFFLNAANKGRLNFAFDNR